MNTFVLIIVTLLFSFFIAYGILIGFYTIGWYLLKQPARSKRKPVTRVSVLIPARNEEANIAACLKDLMHQDFPSELIEITVIDDHSEDDTLGKISEVVMNHPERQIQIARLSGKSGKKAAITQAISTASGKLILTTDADCRLPEGWISSMVNHYEQSGSKMISGPVVFHQENSLFKKFQSLEFLSLIASGAGSISIKAPIMCNGANLAYEKKAFEAVSGYASDASFVSGDDVFLLLKIKKQYGSDAVHFLKDESAIVKTHAKQSLKEFLQQRIRWISKSRGYTNLAIVLASLIIYLFNYMLFATALLSIWFPDLLMFALIFLIAKVIIDFPILLGISSFAKKQKLLWFYPALQIIYVIYVSLIGFAGNFFGFSWKGRKLK